jgi:Tol biopolymer transport system component
MRGALVLATAALLVLPAAASAITDGSIALIDRPSGFGALPFDGVANSSTQRHAISADGCFVVFESENDALFLGDENTVRNIFRKDRCSPGHPLVQVNVSATGQQPAPGAEADEATISASGRYVAFRSDETSLHPDADGTRQLFVKDMDTGTIELASRASDGTLAPGGIQAGVISGNGRAVAFNAVGVLPTKDNHNALAGQNNVYARYLNAVDQTFLISRKEDGTPVGGIRFQFDISFFGEKVAYITQEPVVAGDTGDEDDDAYVASNIGAMLKQTFVSAGTDVTADDVAISSDAKTLAFLNTHPWVATCDPDCGAATNLDPPAQAGDQNLRVISFAHTFSGLSSTAPTRVFWSTDAPLLPASDVNAADDLYAHLLGDLTPTGLSRVTPGTHQYGDFNGQATDDGLVAVHGSFSPDLPGSNGATEQLFVQTPGGTANLSQPEGEALRVPEVLDGFVEDLHAVSADGRFVVFRSASPALGVPFIAGRGFQTQVFVRNVVTGDLTPVSVTDGGAFGNDDSALPSISADGSKVAFISHATNLAPDVPARLQHVYVRDLAAHTTKLLDRGTGGAPAIDGADHPVISGDGKTVVFDSRSTNLPGAVLGQDHVWAANADDGALSLVDTDAAGATANSDSNTPDVSADGSRVEFLSDATNLGGATSSTGTHVYVKDRGTGAVIWASPPETPATGSSHAFEPSLSADGRHVAYANNDPLFGYGSESNVHVFVRDLEPGTTELASGGIPSGTGASQRFPSLSGDGRRLTFIASANGQVNKAYLRDRTTGTTTLVDSGQRFTFDASISSSGNCVAFGSRSNDIVSPGYGPDFAHVYLHAMGGDCPPVAAGGGGPGGGPSPDTTAPVISGLRVTNKRFRLGAKRTALSAKRRRAKRGTTFVFTLSEAARTTIAIAQRKPGRKKGKKCVKPRRGLKKRCTRYVARLTLTRTRTAQGLNRVAFSGRTRTRKLAPGRYRAILRATDVAGNRSKPRTVTFTVVRR